jgi:hypothetical protein
MTPRFECGCRKAIEKTMGRISVARQLKELHDELGLVAGSIDEAVKAAQRLIGDAQQAVASQELKQPPPHPPSHYGTTGSRFVASRITLRIGSTNRGAEPHTKGSRR